MVFQESSLLIWGAIVELCRWISSCKIKIFEGWSNLEIFCSPPRRRSELYFLVSNWLGKIYPGWILLVQSQWVSPIYRKFPCVTLWMWSGSYFAYRNNRSFGLRGQGIRSCCLQWCPDILDGRSSCTVLCSMRVDSLSSTLCSCIEDFEFFKGIRCTSFDPVLSSLLTLCRGDWLRIPWPRWHFLPVVLERCWGDGLAQRKSARWQAGSSWPFCVLQSSLIGNGSLSHVSSVRFVFSKRRWSRPSCPWWWCICSEISSAQAHRRSNWWCCRWRWLQLCWGSVSSDLFALERRALYGRHLAVDNGLHLCVPRDVLELLRLAEDELRSDVPQRTWRPN